MMIKILVVDDHEVFRRGLVALLAEEPDLDLIGEASSGREAVEVAKRRQPDIILMDIHMPGGSGTEAITEIKAGLIIYYFMHIGNLFHRDASHK